MTTHRIHKDITLVVFLVITMGVATVFGILPILAAPHAAPYHVGVVQGATVGDADSPFSFRSLQPTQAYAPFDVTQIQADSFIAVDTKTGDVLLEKNPDSLHALASLTKLLTAGMLYERGFQDGEAAVSTNTIRNAISDYGIPLDPSEPASKIGLHEQQTFSSHDLLTAALVGSANDAVFALVESQGFTPETFRDAMKEYLHKHRAYMTTINEPSGLDWRNESTPRQYARLALASLSYEDIRDITQQEFVDITSTSSNATYHITTTNELLEQSDYIVGGKTGYLEASGYTFTILAKHTSGREIIIVLFGAPSATSRFDDVARIVEWLDATYS